LSRSLHGRGTPTVGVGVDLGARGPADLEALGLSSELRKKLLPYLGLKGVSARAELDRAPLVLSASEVDELNIAVMRGELARLRETYDRAVGPNGVRFDDLPSEAQTAIADVAFQWGPGFGERNNSFARRFWEAATSEDWKNAELILREWAPQAYHGQTYRRRRNAEADLLAILQSDQGVVNATN